MKALLTIGNTLIDISGLVQIITANDKETGEVKFQGNGIVVHRANHIFGDAPIFLKREHVKYLLGQQVVVFTVATNWTVNDYNQYDMGAENMSRTVLASHSESKLLRDMFAMY